MKEKRNLLFRLLCTFLAVLMLLPILPLSVSAATASVSLRAEGPNGTLGSAGGEIASDSYPASYTVYADTVGCTVTKIVYTRNGKTFTEQGGSVKITANNESEFTTSTFTAYTDAGVTATFTVNFKYMKKTVANVMWETSHTATVRSITGNGLNKALSHTMTIPNSYTGQSNLTAAQIAEIQGLIGRSDGLTYMVNYTRKIVVYTPAERSSTGVRVELGTFDGNSSSEIEACLSRWGWTEGTKAAIRQAASSSLSFTTSKDISCTAVWIDSSTGERLYSKAFGTAASSSSSTSVSVSFSEYAFSDDYIYDHLDYSGDTSGRSYAQTYSQSITSSSTPLTVTFYCHKDTPTDDTDTPNETSGSVTVYVRDAETNAVITSAYVSGGGYGGYTNSSGYLSFSDVPYGSYTFTASKSGYEDNTASAYISSGSQSSSITIYLSPIEEAPPDPTQGYLIVYVKDSVTKEPIAGAKVMSNTNQTTNSAGYVIYLYYTPGKTYVVAASKDGYKNSVEFITMPDTGGMSITLYLEPNVIKPTTGSVSITVLDGVTGSVISGASVLGGGYSGSTAGDGIASFADMSLGSYTFTASKAGYYSGKGTASIDADNAEADITIKLKPKPTDGSIKVTVKDRDTNALISGASVFSGDYTGTTNGSGYITFSSMSFGTYTFAASKAGYYSGSASVSISESNSDVEVTIYLSHMPTRGNITVTIIDSDTNTVISEASVSGGGYSGVTDANGKVAFKDIEFGTYSFSVSKTGYYPNSGSVQVTQDSTDMTISIYLMPMPTSGHITVTVKDKDTNEAISGALVTSGALSSATNASGYVSFDSVELAGYKFTVSKDGYISNTGSVLLSEDATSADITVYLSKSKPEVNVGLNISAINGTIYRDSTIMVSAKVKGDTSYDFTPAEPLTVTLEASINDGSVFSKQTKTVICPHGETNLVWFEVDIPQTGYTSPYVTFRYTVSTPPSVTEPYLTDNSSYTSVLSYELSSRSTPAPSLELNAPSTFKNTVCKTNSTPSRSWQIWEWEDGAFVKNRYTAKLICNAKLTPDETAVWKKQDSTGRWTTRSGYGLNTEVNVSHTEIRSDMITGSAKVNAYYPEFNYSTSATLSNMLQCVAEYLSSYAAKFNFAVNSDTVSGNRMHKTPVWFPDGEYSVKYEIYDIWTPAGMLTANTYAIINIEGSMYDDYYTNRS